MTTNDTRTWGGLRRPALHLLWAVPAAVLLSIPLAGLAGLAWGAIGGCSRDPLGVDTQYVALALGSCVGATVVMMLPLLIVPWVRRVSVRVGLAIVLGLSYGLIVALVTHSPCSWRL